MIGNRSLAIVRPERRISPSENDAAANLDSIGKVDLMSRGDNAAITEDKHRIDFIDNFGVGDRVDLVHPHYLAVASQTYLVAATNDIEMSDAHVVLDHDLLHSRHDVQMTNLSRRRRSGIRARR